MTKSKGAPAPYLFRDAARSYLTRRQRGKTTSDVADRLTGRYGGRAVEDMTASVVDQYILDRMGQVSGPTVRREVTTLMAILKMAHLSGRSASVPTVVRPDDGEPRLRRLDEDEQARLLGVGGYAEERALATFMMNTGARVGEAVALGWPDVDLGVGEVVLRSRKGKGVLRERRVPMNDAARVVLGHLKSEMLVKPFRWASSQAASSALDRLAVAAGIDDFTSHDLRRTFACDLLRKRVDVRIVAELLGHTTLDMVMRYAIPSRQLLRDAVGNLTQG